VSRVLASVALAGTCLACRSQTLTPAQVAELLAKSSALSGVEQMTYALPRGCFTISSGAMLKAGDLERDRRLAESPKVRQELQRARDLDLLDFEFSPMLATVSAPPEGCEELWASYRYGAKAEEAKLVKLVAWRTLMSDKALAAGLSPGQTFVYRRQSLVAITGTTEQNADTVVVEYTWQWTAPYESAHLGIRASPEEPAKAIFRKTTDGWRLVQ
jgi:hypothetical protein